MNCTVTMEELSAYSTGEVTPDRAWELARHVEGCDRCAASLAALRQADAALEALPRTKPSGYALLSARRALGAVVRGEREHEIMTLPEVAQFLRLDEAQLEDIADQLPAFELAGQVRVRRERLVEWIRQREKEYSRELAAGWAAAEVFGKGVA